MSTRRAPLPSRLASRALVPTGRLSLASLVLPLPALAGTVPPARTGVPLALPPLSGLARLPPRTLSGRMLRPKLPTLVQLQLQTGRWRHLFHSHGRENLLATKNDTLSSEKWSWNAEQNQKKGRREYGGQIEEKGSITSVDSCIGSNIGGTNEGKILALSGG